jgi:hypothetical protein
VPHRGYVGQTCWRLQSHHLTSVSDVSAVHFHGLMHLDLVDLLAPISPGRRDHHGVGLLSLHHPVKRDGNMAGSRELRGLIPLIGLRVLLIEII